MLFLEMGRDQNLRELNVKVISRFTTCGKREFREWQFSPFFVILSEKIANFCMISCGITIIMGIGCELEFTF